MNSYSTGMKPSESPGEILGLESNVQRALKRVSAPPAFREHLRDGLMMAAHHQQTHHALGYARLKRNDFQWIWLAGAVAIGTALGFIIIRLHTRQG